MSRLPSLSAGVQDGRAPSELTLAAGLALLGYAAMYVQTYWWASHNLWQTDDNAHGPIILVVVLWLFWQLRLPLRDVAYEPAQWIGSALFGVGLVLYVFGRVFEISVPVFMSQAFIVGGGIALLKGRGGLRLAWFPTLYMLFMVPLPSVLIDAATGPLKQWISAIVVAVLYACGYPIARSGVIIDIGQYQLQVADACSGLHSMYSLSALGTLFMYMSGRKSLWHNGLMLLSIWPIAFAANIVRVMVLVLITYYLGDEAGQGFLHGTAGMVLMMVALLIFFLLDSVLRKVLPESTSTPVPPRVAPVDSAS